MKFNKEIEYRLICPWCTCDLTGIAREAWNLTGKREFEITCPCGTKISVRIEIEKETGDEI
jgi:hypothetical protein